MLGRILAMFEQHRTNPRMPFEDANQFRAALAAVADDADGIGHGYLFSRMNNYTTKGLR
jgi:hypothetical protein